MNVDGLVHMDILYIDRSNVAGQRFYDGILILSNKILIPADTLE